MDSFQPLYILKSASPPDKDHDRDPDKRPEFSRSNSHPTPFFTSLGPHAEDGPSFYDLTNSTSLPAIPLPAVPLRFRPIETIDTGGVDDNSTPELSPKVDPTPPAPPLSSTPEATLYTSNYSSSNSNSNINGTKEETASQSLAMEEDAAHGVYLTKEDVHFWSSLHTQNHSLNAKVHHDPSPTRTNSSSPSKEPSPTASPDEATSSSLVHIPSLEPCDLDAFEDDSGDEQNEALYIDRFTEEPDAGEHFMQATSEFFSKMGYWLYNSRVVQYIARDDRVRTKTVFLTEDIWLLGICYTFDDVHEQVCALPEAPRSRKGSFYLNPDAKHRAASTARIHSSPSIFPTLPTPAKANSIHGFGPASEGRGVDRRRPYLNTGASPLTDDSARGYFAGGYEPELDERQIRHQERQFEKQQEKELEKARKAARVRERDIEKEIERNQEKERAKEKARIKNIEKQEKIREKMLAKEKEKEKDRRQQEAGAVLESKFFAPGEDRSNIGLGLQLSDSKDAKHGVVRRLRSMSILQKSPSSMDLLPNRKTGLQDSASSRSPERPLQMRSQSISNLSALSQKSATSSTVSSHEASSRSPTMPSSLKSSISVQEALAIAPKQSVLSKLAHLNLSQKKLATPLNFDDLPDIPVYKVQEDNTDMEASIALSPALPLSPILGEVQTLPQSPPGNRSPNRRRMTISGIFSKDSKSPNSSSSLATLKTLVASRSPPKSSNDTPSRMDGPPSSLGFLGPRITFGIPSVDKNDSTSKKGSVGRVQNWFERRMSSNNIANVFIASTDEPVPQMTLDVTLSPPTSVSGNSEIADLSSLNDFTSHLKQAQQARTRKRSSLFSSTSSSSTPPTPTKSALKSGASRSPTLPQTPTMPATVEASLNALHPLNIDTTPSQTPPINAPWTTEVDTSAYVRQKTNSTTSRHQAPVVRRGLSEGLDGESFSDLVILPPLPPESPTEAFVLLDNEPELSSKVIQDGEGPVAAVRGGYRSGSFVQVDIVKSPESLDSDIEAVKEQSQDIFQQIAAFSSEKNENLSDLQLDWESLWPGKANKAEPVVDDAGGFVHVKESKSDHIDNATEASTPKPERQRVRKTGGTYVKVKEPTPSTSAIIAPQPKPLVPVQTKALEHSLHTSVPEQPQALPQPSLNAPPPNTMRQRALALPSLLTTNIPRLPSPNSAGSSLSRSWRAVSPRSLSPRLSLPVTSHTSSTSASLRSVGADFVSDNKPGDSREARNGFKESGPNSKLHPLMQSTLAKPVYFDEPTPNQRILQRFMQDFQSRMWFTYRKDIARIEPSFYTSDAGWGCMMRTGQSLLAEAFVQIILGRGWRVTGAHSADTSEKYRTILNWFADEPDRYYSIHNIAKSGLALDKRVGDWFGPSTMAHALKQLSQKHVDCPVHVSVPMDNQLRASEIVQIALGGSKDYVNGSTVPPSPSATTFNGLDRWKPVVLLMPVRYGLEKLTEKYSNNLKKLFELPQFLGIAGGRPGRSLYFVACQGNELFYFDPHFVKPRATQEELNQCPAASYHCNVVRTMEMQELDPSMMLGFLIRSQDDLLDLDRRLKNDMEQAYPLVTIVNDISLPLGARPEPRPVQPKLKTPAKERTVVEIKSEGSIQIIEPPTSVTSAELQNHHYDHHEEEHVGRSHKEMKRIAKARKKEQKLMKSRESREKKKAKEQEHFDPYVYRYTTHDGDHVHDQETLSVKSFDSDSSL
ncbi:Cysteine protease atg4b [Mortierella antarctica]|nr:Cysteine protease atg4b [Mortierella antarctica]